VPRLRRNRRGRAVVQCTTPWAWPAVCLNKTDWDALYRNHAEYRRCTDRLGPLDKLADRRRTTPIGAGWYWAEWRIPDDGTHDEEHFLIGPPEVVEVFSNRYDEEEGMVDLRAAVSGVRESQSLDNFVWLSGKLELPTGG